MHICIILSANGTKIWIVDKLSKKKPATGKKDELTKFNISSSGLGGTRYVWFSITVSWWDQQRLAMQVVVRAGCIISPSQGESGAFCDSWYKRKDLLIYPLPLSLFVVGVWGDKCLWEQRTKKPFKDTR